MVLCFYLINISPPKVDPTFGGFLRFSSLCFVFAGKSYPNPCLFCRFLVVCCSVFCFSRRFCSLVLCSPPFRRWSLPPLPLPLMPPRLSPPEGGAVAKSKIFCSLLLSFGGTLKRGGASQRSFFVRRPAAVLLPFSFLVKFLPPLGASSAVRFVSLRAVPAPLRSRLDGP